MWKIGFGVRPLTLPSPFLPLVCLSENHNIWEGRLRASLYPSAPACDPVFAVFLILTPRFESEMAPFSGPYTTHTLHVLTLLNPLATV